MTDIKMNEWGERLQDALLDNSALRDGLTDDEAQPLIDWGIASAVRLTEPLSDMESDAAELRYEELYGTLPRLITRMNWVVTYREKKGMDWTAKTLAKLNDLNRDLYGEGAPQISQDVMLAYASQDDGFSRQRLVLDLIERLTPPKNEDDESCHPIL